jgi:hypothetical protein
MPQLCTPEALPRTFCSALEGHGFSRVPMSLRLTQGDENHGESYFSTRFPWAEVASALEQLRP